MGMLYAEENVVRTFCLVLLAKFNLTLKKRY